MILVTCSSGSSNRSQSNTLERPCVAWQEADTASAKSRRSQFGVSPPFLHVLLHLPDGQAFPLLLSNWPLQGSDAIVFPSVQLKPDVHSRSQVGICPYLKNAAAGESPH